MDKKEFINRRNAIKEDFRVRVDKEGDALSVEAEGENSQEFFDFARCLFGDNFDSFNCDFSDPVQPEQQVEAEIPEVGFDYEAEDQIADVDDPFTAFDEPVEEVEEEPDEETEEEDHEDEKQPMDMINGKLVPAKDPTASEVEIDDEDEDDDEDEEELDESLKDFMFTVKCNDGPKELIKVVAEDKAKAEEYAKKMYAQNHTTYADDRHNIWSIEANSNFTVNESMNLKEGWETFYFSDYDAEDVVIVALTDKRFTPIDNNKQRESLRKNNVKTLAHYLNGVVVEGKAGDIKNVCDECHIMMPSKILKESLSHTNVESLKEFYNEYGEEEAEDHKYENQPMDMINGKLVPAKDPTASEVEIDDEEELEEDLKEQKYDCYFDDKYVGSVYAKSEEEAYDKMEKEWPELHYGEYDGVADVVLSEDYDNEDDFVNAFGEAFYGKKKDLNEAGLGLKNKIKNFAAGVKRAFTTTKVLDKIVKFQVKELDSDGKVIKTYEAKNLANAENLATAASKKSNVDKAQVVAVDYKDQEIAKKYRNEKNPMLFIDSAKKKELALETFRDGKKSDQTGETDVVDTFIQELDAVEQTAKAKTVEATPEKEPEATKEVEPKKEPVETKQPEVQQKGAKGEVLNRKIKRNKAIKAALDKAGFDTSDLVNGKKASDKLNTIRKDLFGEGLQEDYEPQSEEEKALWKKLSDNYCGPDYEYELTYDARNYENSKSVPKVRQTYDGDYVETGTILVGTYYGSFEYYKAPTYEDVLEFLGEDHLTEEGAERFIADDKKKENSEFVEFLTIKYEDEAVDKFYDDLEDGEYDDQMDWDEEWPEPDYDDYDA